MIILLANQKGGCGKSTLACNISVVLAQRGGDVLLVDADRQVSASEWWAERKIAYPDLQKINCVQKYGALDDTLEDLNRRYEYIVVDVPGRDSEELRSALTRCHTLIAPFKPSQTDLNVLPTISQIVKNARWLNQDMAAYAVLSIAPTNTRINEVQQAQGLLRSGKELLLMESVIYDRKVYRDAMGEGLGVTEMTGKSDSEIASRQEVECLVAEVLGEK